MSQVASIDTSAVHTGFKGGPASRLPAMYAIPSAGLTGRLTYSLRKREPMPRWSRTGYRYAGTFTGYPVDYWQRHFGYPRSWGSREEMGGGFLAFLNAELKPGIRLMLDVLDFGKRITGADLIFTGEGRADRQTVMGKVPSGILEEARKQNIPVIVLAGSIEDAAQMNRAGFQGIFSITPGPVTMEKAMEPEFARENIRRLVTQICSVIHPFATR